MPFIVMCRNLPYEAKSPDICKFFQGRITEDQIHLVAHFKFGPDYYGPLHHCGHCFVDVNTQAEKQALLGFHEQSLKGVDVEVVDSSMQERTELARRLISRSLEKKAWDMAEKVGGCTES
jgi:hypothetical protein